MMGPPNLGAKIASATRSAGQAQQTPQGLLSTIGTQPDRPGGGQHSDASSHQQIQDTGLSFGPSPGREGDLYTETWPRS